jgi:hypothetical protein
VSLLPLRGLTEIKDCTKQKVDNNKKKKNFFFDTALSANDNESIVIDFHFKCVIFYRGPIVRRKDDIVYSRLNVVSPNDHRFLFFYVTLSKDQDPSPQPMTHRTTLRKYIVKDLFINAVDKNRNI